MEWEPFDLGEDPREPGSACAEAARLADRAGAPIRAWSLSPRRPRLRHGPLPTTPRHVTPGEYQDLVEFLARQFDRVWKEFARIEERFAGIDERFTGVDDRFARIEGRFAAVDDRFAGIEGRFAGIDERFSEIEERFAGIDEQFEKQREETRSLVLTTAESQRDEIRLVAEGVTTNRRLIEEVRSDVRALRTDVEHLDTKVSVRLDDHEERIRRLE